jgi:hypothetical protein
MTDARRPAGLDLFAAHVLADDAPAVVPIDRALIRELLAYVAALEAGRVPAIRPVGWPFVARD